MSKPPGPRSYYRPKDPHPVTLNLTTEGRKVLDETARRVGASRSDVVEQLLRFFGYRVDFKQFKRTKA